MVRLLDILVYLMYVMYGSPKYRVYYIVISNIAIDGSVVTCPKSIYSK